MVVFAVIDTVGEVIRAHHRLGVRILDADFKGQQIALASAALIDHRVGGRPAALLVVEAEVLHHSDDVLGLDSGDMRGVDFSREDGIFALGLKGSPVARFAPGEIHVAAGIDIHPVVGEFGADHGSILGGFIQIPTGGVGNSRRQHSRLSDVRADSDAAIGNDRGSECPGSECPAPIRRRPEERCNRRSGWCSLLPSPAAAFRSASSAQAWRRPCDIGIGGRGRLLLLIGDGGSTAAGQDQALRTGRSKIAARPVSFCGVFIWRTPARKPHWHYRSIPGFRARFGFVKRSVCMAATLLRFRSIAALRAWFMRGVAVFPESGRLAPMKNPVFATLLVICAAPLAGQTLASAAASTHTDPLGFSFSLPAGWELLDMQPKLPVIRPALRERMPRRGRKEGSGLRSVAVHSASRRSTVGDLEVTLSLRLPWDQMYTDKDLPDVGSGIAEGVKGSFNVVDPVYGIYILGSHRVWIERATGNFISHPDWKREFEAACTLLKSGVACWMAFARTTHR